MATADRRALTVYVVKAEYESGSDNGEVVQVLSVHRTEAGAEAAVKAWREDHDCTGEPREEGEEEEEDDFWCSGCGWGADWEAAEMED